MSERRIETVRVTGPAELPFQLADSPEPMGIALIGFWREALDVAFTIFEQSQVSEPMFPVSRIVLTDAPLTRGGTFNAAVRVEVETDGGSAVFIVADGMAADRVTEVWYWTNGVDLPEPPLAAEQEEEEDHPTVRGDKGFVWVQDGPDVVTCRWNGYWARAVCLGEYFGDPEDESEDGPIGEHWSCEVRHWATPGGLVYSSGDRRHAMDGVTARFICEVIMMAHSRGVPLPSG